VVTIAELRTAENEEAREKGSIAGVNKSGEKIVGLFVDSECMSLENHLHGAIDNREDDVCHSDGGCGDPLPEELHIRKGQQRSEVLEMHSEGLEYRQQPLGHKNRTTGWLSEPQKKEKIEKICNERGPAE